MSANPGRRLLALDLPPGQAFVDALNAAWDRGDAVLPIDPLAPAAAKAAVIATMRPHAVIDTTGTTTTFDPEPLDDDVALIITTSGSTGEPKGVQLSHDALGASAAATAERIGERPEDHWLSCLPWQHIGGLQVLLRARRTQKPLQILEKFDLAAVDDAIAAGATLTSLVPTTLRRLLDADVDLTRLNAILLGGAAAPTNLLAMATAKYAPVVTTYGMSETSGGCVYDSVPLDGVEIRLGEDGRIELSGPVIMRGYRLRPDLTAEAITDGWLRTGDLGQLDEAGRLTVLGRIDDVIVTGGEKVVATVLADAIAGHPKIVEVAVVGVADEQWGQRVVAVATTISPLDLAELREWLGQTVPGWSLPRELLRVEALPKLASGKLDRLAIESLARSAG